MRVALIASRTNGRPLLIYWSSGQSISALDSLVLARQFLAHDPRLDGLVDHEQEPRAADRCQEPRLVAELVPPEVLADERGQHRASNADQRRHDPAHRLLARFDPACEHADKESDQDGPEHANKLSTIGHPRKAADPL